MIVSFDEDPLIETTTNQYHMHQSSDGLFYITSQWWPYLPDHISRSVLRLSVCSWLQDQAQR
jgi:hypothetical protein